MIYEGNPAVLALIVGTNDCEGCGAVLSDYYCDQCGRESVVSKHLLTDMLAGINTCGKTKGKIVLEAETNRRLWATGPSPIDTWNNLNGFVLRTPT